MSDSIIRIQGKAFDHSCVRAKIAGRKYLGIKSIKYDQKRTRGKVPILGGEQVPLSMTRGFYEMGQITVTMLRRSAQDLRDHIASKSADGKSYGDPLFPMSVQYVGPGIPAVQDDFFSCAITGDGGGTESGSADPLYEDVVLDCLKMKRNGKTLFASKST